MKLGPKFFCCNKLAVTQRIMHLNQYFLAGSASFYHILPLHSCASVKIKIRTLLSNICMRPQNRGYRCLHFCLHVCLHTWLQKCQNRESSHFRPENVKFERQIHFWPENAKIENVYISDTLNSMKLKINCYRMEDLEKVVR